MLVSSWLGCAESVLANSAQKHLSVHEILDGMLQSDILSSLNSAAAYSTLAAALFSEIQKPGSKFERSGNKFTLKAEDSPIQFQQNTTDKELCTRRRRRTSTRSSTSSIEAPATMVKLSTTTNPPGRMRSSSSFQDHIINENYQRRVARSEKIKAPSRSALSVTQCSFEVSAPPKKQVGFALDRNEVYFFTPEAEELFEFPSC